mgnify:CR=1 FL=1
MTDYAVTALKSPIAAPTGASRPVRDGLLTGHNGGVRFLFDLDFSWSYPGGALATRPAQGAPANDQVIYDIAERSNGRYRFNTVFQAPRATYAGGGFDYTNITHAPFGVQGPADAWASIYSAANDYFLWCGYYRLPTEADFKPSGGFAMMFSNTPNTGFHITNVEPFQVAQITSSGKKIQFIRQTTGGSGGQVTLSLATSTDYYANMCQLSFWRNASGVGARMKSATAEVSTSAAVGVNNSADFSTLRPTWGHAAEPNISFNSEDLAATNYRSYRGWLEDLSVSGRDPLVVLNADWARVQARIAKSAAANGGTSTIFV